MAALQRCTVDEESTNQHTTAYHQHILHSMQALNGGSHVPIRSVLPGNQILISKYLAMRGVVVSGGGAMDPDGNRLQLLHYTQLHCTLRSF